MIKNLYEDDLGYMVGTFYSDVLGYDIEVRYDKELSQKYVEKNIYYFNNLEQDFLVSICDALRRYYENYEKLYPDLCEDLPTDILNDFEENPTSILRYVKIGVYRFHKCSKEDEEIPVINLGGDCEWAGDAGITIAAKNRRLLYVGRWDNFNIWNSGTNRIFNYAMPQSNL